MSYAQIDWHGFVVVETVDFAIHELGNLPPPTTPEEVGARVLAQERFVNKTQVNQMGFTHMLATSLFYILLQIQI